MDMTLNNDLPESPLTVDETGISTVENTDIVINDEGEERKVYIHLNGEYYNITECVQTMLDEMSNTFKTKQDVVIDIFESDITRSAVGNVSIPLNNGGSTTIREAINVHDYQISQISNTMEHDIEEINQEIEKIKSNDGVPESRIRYWNSKANIYDVELDIPNTGWVADSVTGDAPYTIEVACPQLRQNDRPLIDIIPDEEYEMAKRQMNAWRLIYKIKISAGKITFLASKPLDTAVHIQVKITRIDPYVNS